MKKALWWILGILLSPVLLFIILAILLYLPPVQNWAVQKVTAYASEETGMDITVGYVRLAFPLDLDVNDVRVLSPAPSLAAANDTPIDTIADMQRMVVDVQLLPLFASKVVINELEITNTSLNTNGFIAAARVKGRFDRLFVSSRGIDLRKEKVEVNGTALEGASLDIQLNDSVPEDTTTSENHWKIHVDGVTIERSDLTLHMPGDTMRIGAHMGELTAREALIDLESQTYTVASVDWTNGALRYDNGPAVDGSAIDFNHLDFTDINIGIDSIYYHDPTLRLYLRQVALKEKSGLQITDLSGPVRMENGNIRLPKFRLKTPDSEIDVELDMPLSLTDSIDPGKMRLRMNAQIGKRTLMPFLADMPKDFQQRWPDQPLSVNGQLKGNLQHMDFNDLDVQLPGAFKATATGFVANLNDPSKLVADVQFKAQTQNLAFVMALLPRDMQRDYRLPPMSAQGRVTARGDYYAANMTLHEGRGTVSAKGSFNAAAMRYNADVKVRDLNVHHFMPRDSIYTVSADIQANGQGTDFLSPRTRLQADAKIYHLGYGKWNFDNMTAKADVHNGHAVIDATSKNPLISGRLLADAQLSTKKLNASVIADLKQVDLYKMQLSDNPLAVGLCGHVDVTSDMKLTHYVSGLISDISIRDSVKTRRSEFVGIHIKTDNDTTLARIQSGDFIVKVDASGDYEHVLKQLTILGDSATAQLEQKVINQSALRQLLPTMKLHVESKNDNPIAMMLKSGQGLDFKELLFDMNTSQETGINGNGYIHSLTVSDVKLDTINFRLSQRKERLSFGGQIRNNKKNPQFVFNALFDGILQERGATFGVRVFDANNKLGARIGAQAEMADGGINLHLIPERPTLGYKEFSLNRSNFVFLSKTGKIKADLDLRADDGMGVKIYTQDADSTNRQDLTLSMHQVNLEELTSALPYVPRMTGILNGDCHIVQNTDGQLSMVGDIGVRDMTYERSPIGNVSTELVYMQRNGNAHGVEARLMKDDTEIGLLRGTYYNEGDGSLDAKLQLDKLPLSIVNGFVPDQIIGLKGFADGELSVEGPLSKPVVNGELMLTSSAIESVPYGITLRVDDDPVRIVNSNLLFENFTAYSMNESPLTIQGNVNFSDLDKVMVELRMRAKDFQIIGAKENVKSVAYGKAFVDLFASLKGPVDNLNMRGRLNVLSSTDIGYILRDSPLTTDNHLDNLVKFTDFSDTTQTVVQRPTLNGFHMDMTVDISKGAHVMAYLNTDHSNYIDLLGGGTLRMQYSPSDNLQLTGRYTLSNGEMKYALPFIPLKTFTIQDGSYVEFTGDPMNPTLNITATERVKANVTNANGVGRSVDFDCGVKITKTLNDMGLQFTLDAPEDMQLHSELQSLGVEQRGKLAVTMLTTGMYLADGNTKPFSMNSALSSFLNSEISNLTGNALRTLDLSFGMDNTTDATGNTHTNYSFKFAKRFLDNRLKVVVGGKVTSGAEMPGGRNKSFFDNVSMEYRLDKAASKYLNLFFENNSYDWLDGYTQKYGGGFIWRRNLQKFTDIFRFKDPKPTMMRRPTGTTAPAVSGSPAHPNTAPAVSGSPAHPNTAPTVSGSPADKNTVSSDSVAGTPKPNAHEKK